jgi:hypothetical protein
LGATAPVAPKRRSSLSRFPQALGTLQPPAAAIRGDRLRRRAGLLPDLRMAVQPIYLAHPGRPRMVVPGFEQRQHRFAALGVGEHEMLVRADQRRQPRGRGDVGNAEPVAGKIDLSVANDPAQLVERALDHLARMLDRHRLQAQAALEHAADHRKRQTQQTRLHETGVERPQPPHQVRVAQQGRVHQAHDVHADVVEARFEAHHLGARLGVLRNQHERRAVTLQPFENPGAVVHQLAVGLQGRQRHAEAAADTQTARVMQERCQPLLAVAQMRGVEGPAYFLARLRGGEAV